MGAVARSLYVLASGKVGIRTNIDPDGPGGDPERPVFDAQIAAPDFFGERGCAACASTRRRPVGPARAPRDRDRAVQQLATRKVELESAREDSDATAKAARGHKETERLRRAISSLFRLYP